MGLFQRRCWRLHKSRRLKVKGDEIVPIEESQFDKAAEANKDMADRAMRILFQKIGR